MAAPGLILSMIAVHIASGTVALVSGVTAVVARKGGRIHRLAGDLFFISMLMMTTFACVLAVVLPGQLSNLFGGALAAYLVTTGWLTARPRTRAVVLGERALLGLVLCLAAPFVLMSAELALDMPLFFKSATPIDGYVRIGISVFTALVLLSAAMDARQVLAGGLTGVARLSRHLWRMMASLAINVGSAFTNGLPRVLPKALHPPAALQLAPMVLVIGLLAFWMVRVRFRPLNGVKRQSRTGGSGAMHPLYTLPWARRSRPSN